MITSRIARKPITLPVGIHVKIEDQNLQIKGPKGQFNLKIDSSITLEITDNILEIKSQGKKSSIKKRTESQLKKSIAGTTRAHLANLIHGVNIGFERKLTLVGVGYRAQIKGKDLNLTLGFSHPVVFTAPEGIVIETPSQTEVLIKGADKHLVGHVASTIRAIRPPEPYKGKGIRYSDEKIELKETKKK